MCSPTKIPPTLITTLPQKIAQPLSQKKDKAEDVVEGAAKCIKFSSEDHDDAAGIEQIRYEALLMEIRRLQIRLSWYEETLGTAKMKAKLHLGSVKIMKVRVRIAKRKVYQRVRGNEAVQMMEAEARKEFDLFREYARCVVLGYNWDGITME